jgi:U3 small nucleolar RNA-associated protein 11
MASLVNVGKAFGRLHRERQQPQARKKAGYLENKKDYKARANDFQNKEKRLKLLRNKALNKNPDEFYFHMINSELKDGRHFEKKKKGSDLTPDQMKLMQSQDSKYVAFKRSIELKKIEKLKSGLHLLDVEGLPRNKHILFTDSKEEAKSGDLAKRLETRPDLLSRGYNVPKLESLRKQMVVKSADEATLRAVAKEREKSYRELLKRIEREKQLKVLGDKMALKSALQKTKGVKPQKMSEGSASIAPQYKWPKERKR